MKRKWCGVAPLLFGFLSGLVEFLGWLFLCKRSSFWRGRRSASSQKDHFNLSVMLTLDCIRQEHQQIDHDHGYDRTQETETNTDA